MLKRTFRKTCYFIVALFGATLSVGIAAYAAGAFDSVMFDTLVADVGSVSEGEPVQASFRFHNRGRPTATILDVTPSCGVVASLVRGRKLAHGEGGEVEVRIDTAGYQGLTTGVVAVRLKDPLERTVLLTVKATVAREFVVENPIVDFGSMPRDVRAQRQLRIRLNGTEHRVLSARSTDENFDAYVDLRRTDGIADIVVTIKPQTQPGLRFGTIRIRTSSLHMPELIVPVRAVVAKMPVIL
jgi:hypothetical protein